MLFLPNQVRFLFCEECPLKRAALRQPWIEAPPHTPVVLSEPVFAGSTAPMPESTAEQTVYSLCGQRNYLGR